MAQMQKMDGVQKALAAFLLFALGVSVLFAIADKVFATIDPSGYAAQQARSDAEAQQKASADAEQARIKDAQDAKDREEAFILNNVNETRDNLLEKFSYPGSVEFRNVWAVRHEQGFVFCGEVKAWDENGDYTGYRPFMALGSASVVPRSPTALADVNQACAGARIIETPF